MEAEGEKRGGSPTGEKGVETMYIDERESKFRAEIIELLEAKGYAKIKAEVRSRQEIIDKHMPIYVDFDNRVYAMMGNVTCAAAAASTKALRSREEFYESFSSRTGS